MVLAGDCCVWNDALVQMLLTSGRLPGFVSLARRDPFPAAQVSCKGTQGARGCGWECLEVTSTNSPGREPGLYASALQPDSPEVSESCDRQKHRVSLLKSQGELEEDGLRVCASKMS